jgi:putative RecB family exonuclease
VNCYLGCSARWHYRYVQRLPDPASGSLVRGRAVHKLVTHWFKFRIEGLTLDNGHLAEAYDEIWEQESEGAAFASGEDVEETKASGAALAAKYLAEAAPEIEPAQLDIPVSGTIGGVAVRGYVDLLDVHGTIVDLKTASRKPSGVSPDYALQIATYAALLPEASGNVRLDTVVSTKTPALVNIAWTVSDADKQLVERIYPHVQAGMQSGYYTPNRSSQLCSRKYCAFADACQNEIGGVIE